MISAKVFTVVKAFVDADNAAKAADVKRESKYWPMVDEAIHQIEVQKKSPEDVRQEFMAAMKKAHMGKSKEEPTKVQHTNWLLMTGLILKIARKGQAWIEEQRKAGTTGFWPMADSITAEEAAGTTAVIEKDKLEASEARAFKQDKPAKPSKGKSKASTGKYQKRAEKLGIPTVTVREGKAVEEPEPTRDAVLESLIDHPDRILPLIQQLLKEQVLSPDGWQEVIEKIQVYLNPKEEKAKK